MKLNHLVLNENTSIELMFTLMWLQMISNTFISIIYKPISHLSNTDWTTFLMSTLYMRMIKGHYCIVSIYNDDNVGITDDSVANIAVSNKWSSVHQFISWFKIQFSTYYNQINVLKFYKRT